jgi:hypothetical protein
MNTFHCDYVYDTAEMVLGFIALVLPFVAIPVMLV